MFFLIVAKNCFIDIYQKLAIVFCALSRRIFVQSILIVESSIYMYIYIFFSFFHFFWSFFFGLVPNIFSPKFSMKLSYISYITLYFFKNEPNIYNIHILYVIFVLFSEFNQTSILLIFLILNFKVCIAWFSNSPSTHKKLAEQSLFYTLAESITYIYFYV